MRHRVAGRKLGRTTAHRQALLRNLSSSLIDKERITTTLAKAKELRSFTEKLVTLSKKETLHARRLALRRLPNHRRSRIRGHVRVGHSDQMRLGGVKPEGHHRILAEVGGQLQQVLRVVWLLKPFVSVCAYSGSRHEESIERLERLLPQLPGTDRAGVASALGE